MKTKHPQEKNMSMFFEGKKSFKKYDPPKKIQDNPVIQVTVAAVFFFNGGWGEVDAENVLSLWEEADSRSPECQGKREVMLYLNQK